MKDLQVFENAEFGKLTVIEKDGEPWFIGKEVAEILGYKNGSRDVERHCKYVKLLKSTETVLLEIPPRGIQIINEKDVYRLIMRSKLESAEKFQDWVMDEVLPSIRKTMQILDSIEYTGNIENLVYSRNGMSITTSVNIATVFKRAHREILRAIDTKLRSDDLTLVQFCTDHIKEVTYIDSQNKTQRQYELDEDGFSLIALSLTGEKADLFKIKYIDAFRKMKEALQNMFKARLIESILPQDNRTRQYIYIIKNPLNDTIKIGVAQNVEKRLKQLETGAGIELELIYKSLVCSNAFSIEQTVHKNFEEYRTFGEWFRVSSNIVIDFLDKQTFILNSDFAKYVSVF